MDKRTTETESLGAMAELTLDSREPTESTPIVSCRLSVDHIAELRELHLKPVLALRPIGEEHDDNKMCLIGARGELSVVMLNAQNQTFLVAPQGHWSQKREVAELEYTLPGGSKWKAKILSGPLRFRHEPLGSSPGSVHDDDKLEYISWDGQFWLGFIRSNQHLVDGSPGATGGMVFSPRSAECEPNSNSSTFERALCAY